MTTQIGNCGSALNTPIMSFVLNTLSGNFAPVNTVCIFIPLFGLGVSISSIRFVRSMKRAKSATPQLPSDVIRTESALSDVDLDVITVEGWRQTITVTMNTTMSTMNIITTTNTTMKR